MTNPDREEENKIPISDNFSINHTEDTSVKVTHKYTLGSLETQTFSVKFDHSDKYLAQGCSDGTVNIYNTAQGKLSYQFNNDMD